MQNRLQTIQTISKHALELMALEMAMIAGAQRHRRNRNNKIQNPPRIKRGMREPTAEEAKIATKALLIAAP
jgi:hypothetical protein